MGRSEIASDTTWLQTSDEVAVGKSCFQKNWVRQSECIRVDAVIDAGESHQIRGILQGTNAKGSIGEKLCARIVVWLNRRRCDWLNHVFRIDGWILVMSAGCAAMQARQHNDLDDAINKEFTDKRDYDTFWFFKADLLGDNVAKQVSLFHYRVCWENVSTKANDRLLFWIAPQTFKYCLCFLQIGCRCPNLQGSLPGCRQGCKVLNSSIFILSADCWNYGSLYVGTGISSVRKKMHEKSKTPYNIQCRATCQIPLLSFALYTHRYTNLWVLASWEHGLCVSVR